MNYVLCRRCHNYGWEPCSCEKFEVAFPHKDDVDESEWSEIWAKEAELAVEQAAEKRDSDGDYTIVRSGREYDAWVRNGGGKITKWTVHGEGVPTYYAYPKHESSCAGESQ